MDNVLIYIIIIVAFAVLPLVIDILMAYSSHNKARKMLIDKASLNGLDKDELGELLNESSKPPPGIPGLARSMIALTVILILGVAVFHLLTSNSLGDNSEIINNVLSVLAGLLAAITGFYFGGRAAEKKSEDTGKK